MAASIEGCLDGVKTMTYPSGLELAIDSGRLARALGACVLALAVLHVLTRVPVLFWDIPPKFFPLRLFDLGSEGNLPSLFSCGLLAADAALLFLCGREERRAGGLALPWTVLGAAFCFLALDEWLALHERAMRPMSSVLDAEGPLRYLWVVPYGLGTAALGAGLLPFLRRLPPRAASSFIVAGAVYVAGALGCEMLAGLIRESWPRASAPFMLEVLVEETLEMSGAALFLCALADHLGRAQPRAALSLDPGGRTPERAGRALAACIGTLALSHAASRGLAAAWGWSPERFPVPLLDLDAEGNLPTLFSGALLAADALLLAACGADARRRGEAAAPWLFLAAVFMGLALDEWLTFHEFVGRLIRQAGIGSGVFFYAWVIPYGILTLLLGASYARFLARLPGRTGALFLASGLLFVGGSIGMELVGGALQGRFGEASGIYALASLAEESLEMSGAALFAYALLDRLRGAPSLRVTFGVSAAAAAPAAAA
jgi:hypothetical protein